MKDLVQDGDSLVASTAFEEGVDRRVFLKAAVGSGFAAATLPVMAQSLIQTDTAGLSAGDHIIVIDGQDVPVYRAQPEGRTNLPVILVISEIFGVHEHIKDVARRFAKAGYLAIAPDLFVRQGDATKVANIADLMKDIVSKTPDAQVMSDLDTVVTWAFSGRPARALRNLFTDRFSDAAVAEYPAVNTLTGGIRRAASNDPDGINLWAGSGYRDAVEESAVDTIARLG